MKKDAILHDSFEVGLLLKAIEAALETLGGVALFFVTPTMINNIVIFLTRQELSTDPHDLLSNYLLRLASQFSISSEFFIAIYLLSHGIIKLFIVGYLWKGKLWAYPVGIGFFFIFILYQAYRYTFTHSVWLIVLTILDLIIIFLTWSEYKRIEAKTSAAQRVEI